jgi:hypothetical protein
MVFSEFNLEAIENTHLSNKGREHNPMLPFGKIVGNSIVHYTPYSFMNSLYSS